MTDMFKLWYLAESDMLREGNSYRLCDTGQGLNRVQAAPQVSSGPVLGACCQVLPSKVCNSQTAKASLPVTLVDGVHPCLWVCVNLPIAGAGGVQHCRLWSLLLLCTVSTPLLCSARVLYPWPLLLTMTCLLPPSPPSPPPSCHVLTGGQGHGRHPVPLPALHWQLGGQQRGAPGRPQRAQRAHVHRQVHAGGEGRGCDST